MSATPPVITAVLTGLSALTIFVVPHHAYPEHTLKPRTLWEIAKPVFEGDLPRGVKPLTVLFSCLLLGAFAALYPIGLVPIIRWSLAVEHATGNIHYVHRSWLIASGAVALLGAVINALAILISELSFGFGTSSAAPNRTFGFVAIPLFQAIFSLLSIIIGASPAAARFAFHLTNP